MLFLWAVSLLLYVFTVLLILSIINYFFFLPFAIWKLLSLIFNVSCFFSMFIWLTRLHTYYFKLFMTVYIPVYYIKISPFFVLKSNQRVFIFTSVFSVYSCMLYSSFSILVNRGFIRASCLFQFQLSWNLILLPPTSSSTLPFVSKSLHISPRKPADWIYQQFSDIFI